MRKVTKLTNAPKQKILVVGDDGEEVTLRLNYSSTQEAWNINISEGDFVANGLQLVVSPNMLHTYKNVISFGIACTSTDGFEPKYIDDFQDDRIELFLLSSTDRDNVEEALFE